MPAFARRGDFWSGLVLAALGAWIVSEARAWPYATPEGPGPGFFPLWYGSAMVVLSLLLVAGAVLRPGHGRETSWRDVGRAFTGWAALVACIALMNVLGFALSFALLAWFMVAVMARKPQRVALPIALGGALAFHALFAWALDVPLPRGWLF